MKILDKYITRQLIQSFLFGIMVFSVIFVVIDMIEKMDDFIDKNVEAAIVIEYYIVFLPEIIKLIIPVSVLLSALFVTGKMTSLSELTAIKAAGVNYYRYIMPFLLMAFTVSVLSVIFGGFVVPEANKRKVFIERNYMKKDLATFGDEVFFQDTQTRIVSINYFNTSNYRATRVSIQDFDRKDITRMISRIDAPTMYYDSTKNAWTLINVIKRNFSGANEEQIKMDTLRLTDLNFHPDDVLKKTRKPDEMTLVELKEYANEQLFAGNDPTRILIEYHSRYAFAFASLIVILFGLTISSNNRKSGVALQFGINLIITFIYLVTFKIGEAFGKNGILNPMLTAWSSNILFLAAAIINLFRFEK